MIGNSLSIEIPFNSDLTDSKTTIKTNLIVNSFFPTSWPRLDVKWKVNWWWEYVMNITGIETGFRFDMKQRNFSSYPAFFKAIHCCSREGLTAVPHQSVIYFIHGGTMWFDPWNWLFPRNCVLHGFELFTKKDQQSRVQSTVHRFPTHGMTKSNWWISWKYWYHRYQRSRVWKKKAGLWWRNVWSVRFSFVQNMGKT
jgi:hypothetical protein